MHKFCCCFFLSNCIHCLVKLVYDPKANCIELICLCSYHLAHMRLKGYSPQKAYKLSSESLLYKYVTTYSSVCNLLLYVCIYTKK